MQVSEPIYTDMFLEFIEIKRLIYNTTAKKPTI